MDCSNLKLHDYPFSDNSVDEIMAYHLIEHFDFMQGQDVLREWHRVLKPGGRLHIETPDMLHTCKEFVEADEARRVQLYGHFWAWPWLPGQAHRFLYTETQLFWLLDQLKFKNIKRLPPDSIYVSTQNPLLFLNVEAFK
jgi:predicted SAM-dependent methyltransferase